MLIFSAFKTSCRSGGTGRRVGLKHQWVQARVGSNPTSGTYMNLTFCAASN